MWSTYTGLEKRDDGGNKHIQSLYALTTASKRWISAHYSAILAPHRALLTS
jgi:hypothetical protein